MRYEIVVTLRKAGKFAARTYSCAGTRGDAITHACRIVRRWLHKGFTVSYSIVDLERVQ